MCRNERYVIRFLRKNPELFEYARLKQALIRPGQPERHVLTALGGPAWLNGAGKQTFKIQLRPGVERRCFTCGACEPQKKLFRCSGCQQIWYCSKRCQAAEWKTHKISCREIRREREALDALQYSGFGNIQRSADWMKCRIGSFGANNSVPMHALGMQRDPSRGRTHIIFYNVEYTPRASRDTKNKLRVNSVGVYRTSDVIPEIEASLLMKPGEGKTHIDAMLASVDLNSAQCGTEVRFPGVYILTGKGLVPMLGSFCVCEKTLLNTPYDPNWRLTMNEGAPPTVMCLTRRGVTVQNAEHIFE
ncbi:hypothetical protein BJ138DRAFT_1094953 [Hygrophoropsis aurantiaca]|uniref:Uncharacterized protein n=1 Tax=Hygrophoropsis aurantiaca TaxID=72124 RepID=A0ACB7ZY17_9AGAM|nr:hypothetical protein BJ138DRAFT_1094953 [Hygrophoropsis aurantiaca]